MTTSCSELIPHEQQQRAATFNKQLLNLPIYISIHLLSVDIYMSARLRSRKLKNRSNSIMGFAFIPTLYDIFYLSVLKYFDKILRQLPDRLMTTTGSQHMRTNNS
ncbi:hypothetical protein D917_04386 [Trichinella nativa]|uniref:Uncharacterized protein n=1 Tax=Trichinella nativa TaxID=6335 RepID=A0A1Y3E4Q3_9BILA|nr:hypothetical protein D917_04386 [Trichinella nativa]